tara:strand:- start:294 stop:410 length:117 start_codon:yes stop_codon:yes gene_type:complete
LTGCFFIADEPEPPNVFFVVLWVRAVGPGRLVAETFVE